MSKTSDGLTHQKSLSDLEPGEENRFLNTKPRTVCHFCFKFKLCCSSLLPDSHTRGSDPGSLISSHHITASKSTRVDLNRQIAPPNMDEASSYSLSGLAISSVPHYAKITQSQDRPVSGTAGTVTQESSGVNRSSCIGRPRLPQHSVKGRTVREAGNDGKALQDSTETSDFRSAQATESRCPVPTPRRSIDSVVPVPAARIKTSQTINSRPPPGSSTMQNKSPPGSSHMSKQTTTCPKVKSSHPWMAILHPGPWTQLPPAPPPIKPARSKTVAKKQTPWNHSKLSHPNPFEEEEEEEKEEATAKLECATQTDPSVLTGVEEKVEKLDTVIYATVNKNRFNPFNKYEENEVKPQSKPKLPNRPVFSEAAGVAAGSSSEADLFDTAEAAEAIYSTLNIARSDILPRSVSVPAFTSDYSPSVCLTSCQSKQICKENPFDRESGMTKSKTVQELSSSRGTAPGHGFPLIKRKVQTDQNVSIKDLEVQMRELNKRSEALEQRGLELERNLRDCKNDKEEEQMLTEWFSLYHQRHVLSRRDTELVYQMKQQKLEDKQTDVEYELRCLLNKPESDWTRKDRDREQQLMDELVAIIDQRNQIISCLEQDRQRERTEDLHLEEKMKDKDFQKEKLKELKKSKGKLNPTKLLKRLTHI